MALQKGGGRKIVFFPSDPIDAYLHQGKSYEYLSGYFNPRGYFDEAICLSPWGRNGESSKIGGITYISADPCRFKRIIAQLRPDVVRGYGGYWCADWTSISKVDGIPTVVSVHDTNPELIYDTLKYADFIICMAECVRQSVLAKISFDQKKIWIMPNRIDTELFSPKYCREYFDKLDERFGLGKHILHIGRKTDQKNLDTLIKALTYLDYDVKCIFVGEGEWGNYFDLAQSYGVEDRCFGVDVVKKDELPFWYSWCDCFCTPSRWEGFGFVFIEAAGCEAAIVTSNIAPMNEYLSNGINAILVNEYENPKALAEEIKDVLSGGEKIESMKRNAREVGMQFSKELIDRQEIDIYQKVISMGSINKEMPAIERKKLEKKYHKMYKLRR